MEKIARAKAVFYNTLKRNNVSPEEYLYTQQGMSLLKKAVDIMANSEQPGREKRALWNVMEGLAKALLDPSSAAHKLISPAALGVAGGYGLGAAAGKLTSPTSTTIGNLQKKEMIAEYDTAITELQNRIGARAV